MGESSSPQPSLTVLGGPMAGQRLVLDDAVANLLIGSDPSCDLYLPHDNVSPIHARLWMDLEGAVLHDTNSPHGVYVNDERVAGQHPLRNGDIVWLGPPGGAGAVMIQCVLPEHAAEVEAPPKAARADTDEQETLAALAPTMAAAPSFADLDDRPPDAEPPDWDLEPPPVPTSAPETDLDESSRTQAFKRPADFAAALAAAPRSAPPPPPDEPSASLPPGAAQPDELDHLFSEHVAAPREDPILEPQAYVVEPEATIVEPEATIIDSAPVFAEAEPASTDTDPYIGDPQADAAEPEVIEAYLPEPEATLVMPSGGPTAPPPVAKGALAGEPAAEFDDMMFTVPDEPPLTPAAPAPAAASPPPAAATTPAETPEETVLLPAPPRAQPPPAPPSPPVPARPAAAAATPAPPSPPPARPPAAPPPRPVAARTAAPGPGPAPPRPAAARAPRAVPAAAAARPSSKALPVAALAGAGVLAVAAAAGAYWFFGRSEPARTAAVAAPPVPSTLAHSPVTTPPAPALVAEPTPEVPATVAPAEDLVTIVRSATPPPRPPSAAPTAAATPRPTAVPRPDLVDPAAATRARIAAQVTGLLGQAQSAASARSYDAALAHYDAVLKLDPQNAAAQAGRTSATAARAHARKRFVAGRTVVRTEKAGGGLAGFESAGVSVQKAPDFLGRLEYEMTPASVQPGDPWTLKIYVVNEGKKEIKISALSVATIVNGSAAGSGGPPRVREVAPQQRALVDEISGTWPAGATSWRTDVTVTAGRNEALQSQLAWR